MIDSLARLAARIDVIGLPFSKEELHTLARRFRESFMGSERKKERLARYKVHLAKTHGTDVVEAVSAAFEQITGEIGWEEK